MPTPLVIRAHPSLRIFCLSCGRPHDVPKSCGNRFCSLCGGKRLRRIRRHMQSIVKSAPFKPGYHWRHWILTIPTSSDPGAAAQSLLASFRRLRQRVWWRRHIQGGFAVIEFTFSNGFWHVHLHCGLHCGYIPVRSFRAAWAAVSKGRYVRLGDCSGDGLVSYLVKYVSSEKIEPSLQIEASKAFRNRRLFLTFGFSHSLKIKFPANVFPCPGCGTVSGWLSECSPAYRTFGIDSRLRYPRTTPLRE